MPGDSTRITSQGTLSADRLQEAVQSGIISSHSPIPARNFQPASLDLRLGDTAYGLQCSFLPHPGSVEAKLAQLTIAEINLRDGAVLERNRPYLIPLLEELDLPDGLRARANPKSSTGRLDIFTRVITDQTDRFDDVPGGYRGRMYLEVFSRSFAVRVQTQLSLNQIRVFQGDPRCRPGELLELHRRKPVILPKPVQLGLRPNPTSPAPAPQPTSDNTAGLSIDLDNRSHGTGYRGIGYQAKKNSKLLDLTLQGKHDPRDFWELVFAAPDQTLILEPEEFYLLSSAEEVSIPPNLTAEMAAFEASSGELRTHYAGFFDPGFGYSENGRASGIPATLEVRAHDVPFMISPGQRVCTLSFERMLDAPKEWYGSRIRSSYREPGQILSKLFRPDLTV